jgi:SAM-dependent methyltransferase
MDRAAPPLIFSPRRRLAVRQRMRRLQERANAPRYLIDDMADDVIERLAFLRVEPARSLVIGDWTGGLPRALSRFGEVVATEPAEGFDEERPYPLGDFDFIASLGTLDTVNDLPGALIHLRHALAPGGLMIASFVGAGSLPQLRAAMLVADSDRAGPRIHPQVDVRAGGQLLQRTGFADPVIDSRPLDVSFRSMAGLVADLRAMGLSNVLANPGPPYGKAARERADAAFTAQGSDGRTTERFEIVTLSGWRR